MAKMWVPKDCLRAKNFPKQKNSILRQHIYPLYCLIGEQHSTINFNSMSLTLRTSLGCTEAVIEDDGSLKRFYQVADIISGTLKMKFTNKEDDFDAISWDFFLNHHALTLHYSIYNGISVFPTKTKDARKRDNKAVVELANLIRTKLTQLDSRQSIA